MTELRKRMLELSDAQYAEFQAKLAPTVAKETFIGVRLPQLRALAKDFEKTAECAEFLSSLPHEYYDENILHSVILSRLKDFDRCLELVESFLPYVDNWAVCDTLRPKVFCKHRAELMPKILEWTASDETYTIRFGIDMLMTYFLDEGFEEKLLEIPARVTSDEYYVRMMVAWYYATALSKQWDATVPYIENRLLPQWTHNKTIQKACESFRITDEQKRYLKTLKY